MPFIYEGKVYSCSCGIALLFTRDTKSDQLCLWHSPSYTDSVCPNSGKYFDIPRIELQERPQ